MPYASGPMQGSLYPTVRTARCPSYHACTICTGCTNYNPHDMLCAICESRKPVEWICTHSDKQQHTKVVLDEFFRQPMFHPDTKPREVEKSIAYNKELEEDAVQMTIKGYQAIKETTKR